MPGLLAFLRSSPLLPVPPAAEEPRSVQRARSMVGKGKYGLGNGGRDGDAPTPLDANGRCDCSGFALAWVDGVDRKQPDGWLWCDGVYADATGPQKRWRRVRLEDAQPGDRVVYKGTRKLGRRKPGHCGVVVAVNGPGWNGLDVIDCAGRLGAAIAHRTGALWGRKGGIVVRLNV
jgi:cell wall-associated NlpC family hydrolase